MLIALTAVIMLNPIQHPKIPGYLYTYPGGFTADPHRTEYGCGIPPEQDTQQECDYTDEQRGWSMAKTKERK